MVGHCHCGARGHTVLVGVCAAACVKYCGSCGYMDRVRSAGSGPSLHLSPGPSGQASNSLPYKPVLTSSRGCVTSRQQIAIPRPHLAPVGMQIKSWCLGFFLRCGAAKHMLKTCDWLCMSKDQLQVGGWCTGLMCLGQPGPVGRAR